MSCAPLPRAISRLTMCVAVLALAVSQVQAGDFFRSSAVGGVSIGTDGILKDAQVDDQVRLARDVAEDLADVPADLNEFTELRMVSLRRLQEAVQDYRRKVQPVPQEIQYLAGLQGIRYVFVYPEENDIVLAGPAEGWKVTQDGYVVGRTTGDPVLKLDDLLVALRTAEGAARGGIFCSIDPTQQGRQQLQQLVSQLKTIGNPSQTMQAMEKAMGPQEIKVGGVPATSHFARVLVAADFQMKRLAMGFEPAPVRGLPSFLQMASSTGRGLSNMMPRWWLEPKYAGLFRDAEGMSWELRGGSVKCATESDFLAANGGRVVGGGDADPTAQKWADLMTEKYDELAAKDHIFAELKNVMDLAVVAALITKERLPERAGMSLGMLLDPNDMLVEEFPAPKQVDSQASFLKKGRNWLISISGGVQMQSWAIADDTQTDSSVASVRGDVRSKQPGRWWWQ